MTAAEPPAPPPAILYVDTSALLKLLVREAESAAIERELLTWRELATSVIAEVELPRAVARAREERADAVIDGSVVLQGVLSSAAIVVRGRLSPDIAESHLSPYGRIAATLCVDPTRHHETPRFAATGITIVSCRQYSHSGGGASPSTLMRVTSPKCVNRRVRCSARNGTVSSEYSVNRPSGRSKRGATGINGK
jgi:uncharacterized protein with PIN domain